MYTIRLTQLMNNVVHWIGIGIIRCKHYLMEHLLLETPFSEHIPFFGNNNQIYINLLTKIKQQKGQILLKFNHLMYQKAIITNHSVMNLPIPSHSPFSLHP